MQTIQKEQKGQVLFYWGFCESSEKPSKTKGGSSPPFGTRTYSPSSEITSLRSRRHTSWKTRMVSQDIFYLFSTAGRRLIHDASRSEIGEKGLLKQLTKQLLEWALAAELTEHVGYEKHDGARDQQRQLPQWPIS
jgi:hypothetical protein